MMEKILVVVDMQKDFVTGVLGSAGAQRAVGQIAGLIKDYRASGGRVIYTADTHSQEEYDQKQSEESKRLPRHCVKGEEGWEIVDELKPAPGEAVVEKATFGSLDIEKTIGEIDPSVAIEVCGVCTDICVISNVLALKAKYPANRITVNARYCAGTSPENHKAALLVMESCLINVPGTGWRLA
ncbi:MAG: cysteine hydrolase [Oscillospiraceae bacterium]|nr:cysteine hydrolase [Oscillospiraceae bacterium]